MHCPNIFRKRSSHVMKISNYVTMSKEESVFIFQGTGNGRKTTVHIFEKLLYKQH